MNKYLFAIICLFLTIIYSSGLAKDKGNSLTVTDIDGNVYKTVTIGSQTWMAENLKVTRYRDGVSIPLVDDPARWRELTSGAYCNYDNDLEKAKIYGRLYNFYAVSNPGNICPKGWHVPADAEWQKLINYLGGDNSAGGKLKETDGIHWRKNTVAKDSVGFNALPGGCRDIHIGSDTLFDWIGSRGWFWSSTEWGDGYSWEHDISDLNSNINHEHYNNRNGFSVRCIKN